MTTPGLLIGRYEVGERLGKGGFGVVHIAHDIELGREVAIKFLRPEYMTRTQVVSRFLQEARACAKIGHPGIVTVFEAGIVEGTGQRIDGTAYIVMERLHGETLGERIKTGGRLQAIAAIGIARQLATALSVAHAAGIIHRDLKPDNVYLVRDAAVVGGERVKILDFGVAKLADPDGGESDVHTHSQMMLGTPRYMSPEQARAAGKVDHRTDIYALGCLLYELVCGKAPFGGDIGDIIVAHQTAPITPPRELVSTVPAALDSLIVRMLAKEPEARPDSMALVDDALDNVYRSLAPAKKRLPTDTDDEKTTRKVVPEQLLARQDHPLEHPMPTPVTLIQGELPTVVRPPIMLDDNRRALMIRIGIGIGAAVLSGLIVYLILRGNGDPTTLVVKIDAAIPVDAALVVIADVPAPTIDAIDADRLVTDCKTAQADKRWVELAECGRSLAAQRPTEGKEYVSRATSEARAEVTLRNVLAALAASDFKTATTALADIPATSVYRKQAEGAFSPIVDGLVAELDGYTAARDCARHAARLKAFEQKYGTKLADEGRIMARPCKGGAGAVTAPPPTGSGTTPTPLDACDPGAVSEAEKHGDTLLADGSFGPALAQFEKVVKCKAAVVPKAYMASCRAKSFVKAKKLFMLIPVGTRDRMAQICISQGYDPRGEE